MSRSARLIGWTAAMLLTAVGCSRQPQPDAYGNVEATEVVVSAEASGQLVSFTAQEGQKLAADAVVGTIDPKQLTLERDQLEAQRGANASRVNEVGRQVQALEAQRDAAQAQQNAARAQGAALETQHEIARRAYERTKRLFAEQAATAQQLDQVEKDVRVLEDQIKAQGQQVAAQGQQVAAYNAQMAAAAAQRQTAGRQVASAEAQVAQVGERIRKSEVRNPSAGTVLVTYAKQGEFVQPGQPLYKVADLEAVDVRAYITEPQLAGVRIGQQAQVTIDVGGDRREPLSGTVSWVSSDAEFTPTPIQTRDERADLVYAVKIRVDNRGGRLKIGMPVDVKFVARTEPS
jgi:HlyD family secretion protein